MTIEHFLSVSLRVSLLCGFALVAVLLLRRASASTRRSFLALALGGALALPLVSAVAPAWRVASPVRVPTMLSRESVDPPAPDTSAVASAARDEARTLPSSSRPAHRAPVDLATVVTALWIAGALLVFARLGVGLVRARAMVRRATPAAAWLPLLERAQRAGASQAEIRESEDVDGPAVTGVFAPVVLVPCASSSWSEERRLAVLLHELAHVRQRDCLAQVVAQLACAIHWYNPLVWLCARFLRVERELAADDAVISAGARPSAYAGDLLAIAGATRHVPLGALGFGEPSRLIARISAVLATHRSRTPLGSASAAALGIGSALLVLVVACATPTVSPDGAETPTAARTAVTPLLTALGPTHSSVDAAIQAAAEEELDRALAESKGIAGAIVVLDPRTGEIRANAGRSHGALADVGAGVAFVTGSTLKTVTLSAALDEGVVSPADRFDCEHGAWELQGKTLHDSGSYGVLSLPEMLQVSTNIGFSKVFLRVGGARLSKWLRAFHFGEVPPVGGAASGWVPEHIDESFAGAVVAIGEKVTASPLQVASAYGAVANGGVYVAPTLAARAGDLPGERIMKEETARTVASMLEEAVSGPMSTGKLARIAGVRVAGKTGTASWELPGGVEGRYASFVGFVPAEAPRFVIVVGVEQPKDDAGGGQVAAPVFARVAARALATAGRATP